MEFVTKKLSDTISIQGVVNVHFFEFTKDYYTKNDKHPFYEIVYVSSGKLTIQSEDFNGELEKNKLIIHRENENHALTCDNDSTPTVIIIGFTCTGSGIEKFSKTPITLTDADVKKLAEIIKEARNVFAPPYDVPVYDMKKKRNAPYGAEQMLKILLEYFLIGLMRKSTDGKFLEESNTVERLNVSEIIDYINDNFLEKITLDELAFIFRTNRSTLCKEFKSFTKMTITEYINDKKLRFAKNKILKTSKTFTEIAEELNFESIHYFTRFFKKMTGLSPKEFRKQQS
ncbi:MAG: helix-turn-helix transcriptional regulator [Clostridia bacterium]|nr:helix-turn-helix transcriptional regulator [Clostridia bacterium]